MRSEMWMVSIQIKLKTSLTKKIRIKFYKKKNMTKKRIQIIRKNMSIKKIIKIMIQKIS